MNALLGVDINSGLSFGWPVRFRFGLLVDFWRIFVCFDLLCIGMRVPAWWSVLSFIQLEGTYPVLSAKDSSSGTIA
jgi:hypothetical protein